MDPYLAPEPSSLSHCSAHRPGYHEQDYSVSLSQEEYLQGNIQSNGLGESLNIFGSPSHPSRLHHLCGKPPFRGTVHPVLTCRVRIRIPVHPRISDHAKRSVSVMRSSFSPFRRYALSMSSFVRLTNPCFFQQILMTSTPSSLHSMLAGKLQINEWSGQGYTTMTHPLAYMESLGFVPRQRLPPK